MRAAALIVASVVVVGIPAALALIGAALSAKCEEIQNAMA